MCWCAVPICHSVVCWCAVWLCCSVIPWPIYVLCCCVPCFRDRSAVLCRDSIYSDLFWPSRPCCSMLPWPNSECHRCAVLSQQIDYRMLPNRIKLIVHRSVDRSIVLCLCMPSCLWLGCSWERPNYANYSASWQFTYNLIRSPYIRIIANNPCMYGHPFYCFSYLFSWLVIHPSNTQFLYGNGLYVALAMLWQERGFYSVPPHLLLICLRFSAKINYEIRGMAIGCLSVGNSKTMD